MRDQHNWKKWLQQAETGKFAGLWSLGSKSVQLTAASLVWLIVCLLFFINPDIAWLAGASVLLFGGIIWYLHSSWLWREKWRLEEARNENVAPGVKKELSMAIKYLEGHIETDKTWGNVMIIIAGWLLALWYQREMFGSIPLVLAGLGISVIVIYNVTFRLVKRRGKYGK